MRTRSFDFRPVRARGDAFGALAGAFAAAVGLFGFVRLDLAGALAGAFAADLAAVFADLAGLAADCASVSAADFFFSASFPVDVFLLRLQLRRTGLRAVS